ERRAPACLLDALKDVRGRSSSGVAADLRRRRGGRRTKRSGLPGSAADDLSRRLLAAAFVVLSPRRALAGMLLVPEQIELVPRRGLERQTQVRDPPAARRRGRPRRIRDVG